MDQRESNKDGNKANWNSASNSTEQCDHCGKVMNKGSLLKYIGQRERKKCKDFYGPKFDQLLRAGRLETWKKYSQKKTPEEKEKTLTSKKQKKTTKRQKNISLAKQGLNCDSKKEEPESEFVEDYQRQCEFCRNIFDVTSILGHISKTEECRLFYGPMREELKRLHNTQRKQYNRKVNGTAKEIQQKNRYNSIPEVKSKNVKYVYDKYQKELDEEKINYN